MKKRFFYSHPIIGALIALVLVTLICNAVGGVASFVAAFANMYAAVNAGEIEAPAGARNTLELVKTFQDVESVQTVFNAAVAVCALLCLVVFCLLNRKNGYRGPFKIRGEKLKDVNIFIAVFIVLDIVSALLHLFTQPGGFPKIPVSLGMIVMALYAGINEEAVDRAIPAAMMMRNKPTSRRIVATVVLTSVLFGVSHIVNLLAGRGLVETIVQIVFAAGAGLFFIGIYLRTGSITLTIVIHALHDFLVFVNTSIPEAESTFFLADLLPIIVNVLPFVFGILMLRSRHHAAIIDTWTRIWPEKNAPAQTENP